MFIKTLKVYKATGHKSQDGKNTATTIAVLLT